MHDVADLLPVYLLSVSSNGSMSLQLWLSWMAGNTDAIFQYPLTLQMLDDCGISLTFAKADIYNDAKIVLHKDRVLRHIVVPYEHIRSSRDYSWYQHI